MPAKPRKRRAGFRIVLTHYRIAKFVPKSLNFHMRYPTLSSLALVAAFSLVSGTAPAAVPSVFADAAAFRASLESGSYLQTFQDLSLPHPWDAPQPPSMNFSSVGPLPIFSYTVSSTRGLWTTATGDTGSKFLGTYANYEAMTIDFTHSPTAPTAIGGYFFNTDPDGNFLAGELTITLNDGTEYSVAPTTWEDSPYLGFTTDAAHPFTTLSFVTSSDFFPKETYAFVSLDNLVVGRATTPIPEPATCAFGVGALALGFALWRRRR